MRKIRYKIEDPDHFLQQTTRIDSDGVLYIIIQEGNEPLRFPKFLPVEETEKETFCVECNSDFNHVEELRWHLKNVHGKTQ